MQHQSDESGDRSKRALGNGLYYRAFDGKYFCLVRARGESSGLALCPRRTYAGAKALPAIKAALLAEPVKPEPKEIEPRSRRT